MKPVLRRNEAADQLEIDLSPCSGMDFRDCLEKVKTLPGRQFTGKPDNLWLLPDDPALAERVVKMLRPQVDQEVLNWITASKGSAEESLTTPLPDDAEGLRIDWAYQRAPWQPEYVNDEKVVGLLPYQRSFVDVAVGRKRVLLADDMGLGKSLQAISAIEEYRERNGQMDGPKLIIAPSSVKGAWARELHRWLEDPEVVVIKGSYSPRKAYDTDWAKLPGETPTEKLNSDQLRTLALQEAIENCAWIIINWEQLRIEKHQVRLRNGGRKTVVGMKNPLFEETEWLAVVADEIHRAKNREAKQTKGLFRVKGQIMLGLTGTPIMNSPDELWAILHWLWPDEYGRSSPPSKANPQGVPRTAYWAFYEDYVDYWEDHFGKKVITGVKNPDALRFALRDKLVRRLAKGGGRKRIYEPIPLNPKQQKLYDEAVKSMWLAVAADVAAGNKDAIEFAQRMQEGGDAVTMYNLPNGAARMVRLQQIIENPALLGGPDDSAIMDYFEQKFEDSRPEPWVFPFKYKGSCEIFAERLRKQGARVAVYHGDVHALARTEIEDDFQAGELDAIVGTIDAMKEGITLTASHLMGFGSRSWVPAWDEQMEAREDRLGQQHMVTIYIPLAIDTVADGKVEPTARLKEQIVSTVIQTHKIKEG